jgi:hypothetical protein
MKTSDSVMAMTLKEFHSGCEIPECIKVLHLSNPICGPDSTSIRSTVIFPEWLKFVVVTIESNTLMTTKENRVPIIINRQYAHCGTHTNCGYNEHSFKLTRQLVPEIQDLYLITYDDLVMWERTGSLVGVFKLVAEVFSKKRPAGRSVGVYVNDRFYLTELTDEEVADTDLIDLLGRHCKSDFNQVDSDNMAFRGTIVNDWLFTKHLILTDKDGYLCASYGIYVKYPPDAPLPSVLAYLDPSSPNTDQPGQSTVVL